jgi:hypothetical protein
LIQSESGEDDSSLNTLDLEHWNRNDYSNTNNHNSVKSGKSTESILPDDQISGFDNYEFDFVVENDKSNEYFDEDNYSRNANAVDLDYWHGSDSLSIISLPHNYAEEKRETKEEERSRDFLISPIENNDEENVSVDQTYFDDYDTIGGVDNFDLNYWNL